MKLRLRTRVRADPNVRGKFEDESQKGGGPCHKWQALQLDRRSLEGFFHKIWQEIRDHIAAPTSERVRAWIVGASRYHAVVHTSAPQVWQPIPHHLWERVKDFLETVRSGKFCHPLSVF